MRDKTPFQPEELLSPVAYRQAIANNRILVWIAVFISIALIAEAIAIVSLFPLKDTRIKIVEFVPASENFVRVLEPGESLKSDALIVDYFVRKYIVDRESWDPITNAARMKYIRAVSSDSVFNDLRALFTDPKSPHARKDFKRAVKILRVSAVTARIRQVEFETTDTYGAGTSNQKTEHGVWVATLKMSFADRGATYDQAELNPLGLMVEDYSIAKRSDK